MNLDELIDSKKFREMVKECTGYPEYDSIERGFDVYKDEEFSELMVGTKESVDFKSLKRIGKNLIIRVHYHPEGGIIPSGMDLFSDTANTIYQIQNGPIPYFGIIASQKGLMKVSRDVPEMLVYSYDNLMEKKDLISEKELGVIKQDKIGISMTIFGKPCFHIKEKNVWIPYEKNKYNFVFPTLVENLYENLVRTLGWTFCDVHEPSFRKIAQGLKLVDGMNVFTLKQYDNLDDS